MVNPRKDLREIRPYKPGKPIEELARELGIKGEIIKLASNENPLGPSPKAIKALREDLSEAHLYPDDHAFLLKRALAERYGVREEELIIGNGSVELIYLAPLAYLEPEDVGLTSEEAFIIFQIACKVAGREVVMTPHRNFRHDLEAIANAITPRTKLIYLANPNNPTGTMLTREELDGFMARIPEGVLVILDDAYHEYVRDPDYPDPINYFRAGRDVLILRTFSKVHGLAGLRIGYGIAKPEIIQALMKVRYPFNANQLGQIAALASLDDSEHIRKSVEVNEAGKEFLYKELDKLGLFYLKSHTNFIFVDVGRDSTQVFEGLQRMGIITRPVKEYNLPTALRITVGTPQQNSRLIEALKKVLNG